MSFRRHLQRLASLALLLAGTAQGRSIALPAIAMPGPWPGRAPAVVAWRPRAWRPAVGTGSRAQIAIDPIDGAISMPAASSPANLPGAPGALPMTLRPDGSRRVQLDDRLAA